MADVNGESFGGRWRCNLSYWTSVSATSISIGGTCQFQSLGYGMSLSGFYAHVDVNGNVNSTESTSFYSPTGGWVTKDIISHSQTFTRTHSDYGIYINACIDRRSSSYYPGKSIPTAYLTIQAKDHWTVSYNANNGAGAPDPQTKWYDETLTLSSTKPTRTGYSFQGWATSAGGAVAYQPGASYTSNDALTLYAVWKANTWTVKFDANGGSGAPEDQTKTYGIDLTLSSTKPTRPLYNFLGWGTSSSSSAIYQPGGKYTANADITLYAVWELAWVAPKLNNPSCFRCNQNGVADDTGTYVHLSGDWVTDRAVKSIVATVNNVSTQISGTGKAGTISVTFGDGKLSAEQSWVVTLVITDEIGPGTWTWTVSATHYILDFAPNGSIGVGTVADGSTKTFKSDLINTTSKLWIVDGAKNVRAPSNSGYFNFLTITLKQPLANDCLNFKVAQRNREICELYVRFNGIDTATSASIVSLHQIVTSNGVSPFKYTYADGVLKVYAPISEANDRIGVIEAWYDAFHTENGYFPYDIDYSGTYYSTLPDGAANVTIKSGGIRAGSGLTITDCDLLSVSPNLVDETWQSTNPYIRIHFSAFGKLIIARIEGYRSEEKGWRGETNGSYWGVELGTVPEQYRPAAEVYIDGCAANRFWTGIAYVQFNIRPSGLVTLSSNSITGYANTFSRLVIYPAA